MIEDDFEPHTEITLDHAARTAARVVQLRETPRKDQFLKRLEGRLWKLLDTRPEAREEFGCPDDQALREYAADLDLDQLTTAAERLAQRAGLDASL